MSNNRTCAQGCNGCDECTDFDSAAFAEAPAADAVAEALQEYLEAQDSLDNRELNGINAEPFEMLMRRRNAARRDLDAAMAAQPQQATLPASEPDDEAVRAAFRAADEASPMRDKSRWQIWRDAASWALATRAQPQADAAEPVQWHAEGGE